MIFNSKGKISLEENLQVQFYVNVVENILIKNDLDHYDNLQI
jgi:hypothetical protein